jgi:uncharacterized protein YndB with AHSA1/START domain
LVNNCRRRREGGAGQRTPPAVGEQANLKEQATMNTPSPRRQTGHEPLALVVSRIFDAAPAMVFSLWSDPAQVKEWWHPKDFTTPVFEMDFRVGGRYRYCIRSQGRDSWARGTYREIDAPTRLVFTFQWDSGDAAHDAETLVTLTFDAESGERTRLTFRQEPFRASKERDSHAEGWGQLLDAFAQFVAAQGSAR